MRAFIVNSTHLTAGRDNPAGRWDVAFHSLTIRARRALHDCETNPEEFTEADFLKLASSDRQAAEMKSMIRQANTRGEILAAIMHWLKLVEPSPELRAGLELLAKRIARERALALTEDAKTQLERAAQLKS